MKLPGVFTSKSESSEKKIEQLINGPKIIPPDPNIVIDNSKLEEVLEEIYDNPYYFKSNTFHSKINTLLEEKHYSFLDKKSCYEYWSKQDPLDIYGSLVLTRKHYKAEKKAVPAYSYAFARVNNDDLKKFCRVFENYCLLDDTFNSENSLFTNALFHGTYLSLIAGGIGGGALLTSLSFGAISPFYYPLVCVFGALAGSITSCITFWVGSYGVSAMAEKLDNAYRKKTKNLYKVLITDDRQAINAAFS
ncbi:MAG: hypothetical protein Q8N77_03520 [Nanoarchaeota archaeon]|nr:hypothetical protein [Nanoarchaeota archaeon]